MSKLGTYRGKEVHDYSSGAAADEASQLFDILAVYWTGRDEGVMLWRGEDVGYVKIRSNGDIMIEDFDEDVFQPKRKETPVAPEYVKETKWEGPKETQEKRPAKETTPVSADAETMYDKNWYEKIMVELNDQWESMRPEEFK